MVTKLLVAGFGNIFTFSNSKFEVLKETICPTAKSPKPVIPDAEMLLSDGIPNVDGDVQVELSYLRITKLAGVAPASVSAAE